MSKSFYFPSIQMFQRIVVKRQECLDKSTLLVERLRKRITPDTEVSDDLPREIKNLKKYSNNALEATIEFRIEDIDEETKENA